MNENKNLTVEKVEFKDKGERKIPLPLACIQLNREEVISIVVQDLREGGQIYQALLVALKRALRQGELPL